MLGWERASITLAQGGGLRCDAAPRGSGDLESPSFQQPGIVLTRGRDSTSQESHLSIATVRRIDSAAN